MKITIDTKFKKLIIEDSLTIDELNEFINKFIPKEEFNSWTLSTDNVYKNIFNPPTPIIIERWRDTYPQPFYPRFPTYTGDTIITNGTTVKKDEPFINNNTVFSLDLRN